MAPAACDKPHTSALLNAQSPFPPVDQYSDFFDMLLQYDLAVGTPPGEGELPTGETQDLGGHKHHPQGQAASAPAPAAPVSNCLRVAAAEFPALDLGRPPSPRSRGSGSGSGSGPLKAGSSSALWSSDPTIGGPRPTQGGQGAAILKQIPGFGCTEVMSQPPQGGPSDALPPVLDLAAPAQPRCPLTLSPMGHGPPKAPLVQSTEDNATCVGMDTQQTDTAPLPDTAPLMDPLMDLAFDPSVYDVAPDSVLNTTTTTISGGIKCQQTGRGRFSSSGGGSSLIFTEMNQRISWDGGPIVTIPSASGDRATSLRTAGQILSSRSSMMVQQHTNSFLAASPPNAAGQGWGAAFGGGAMQVASRGGSVWSPDPIHLLQHQQQQMQQLQQQEQFLRLQQELQMQQHQELAAESAEAAMHASTALILNHGTLIQHSLHPQQHQQQYLKHQQQMSCRSADLMMGGSLFPAPPRGGAPTSSSAGATAGSTGAFLHPASLTIPGLLPGDLDPTEEDEFNLESYQQSRGRGSSRGDFRPRYGSFRGEGGTAAATGSGILDLPVAAEVTQRAQQMLAAQTASGVGGTGAQ